MPIDPKLQPYIDGFNAAFPTPPQSMGAVAYRAASAARRAAQSAPPPVPGIRLEDRIAEANGLRVPVRIYRPDTEPGSVPPGLVFIHGGGFVIGSVTETDPLCMALAAAVKCTVVSIEYRLAPEHPYPAGLSDCEAAVDWLRGNAAEVAVDPHRLAVCGASAGGGLATALCQKYRNRGLTPFRLQALLYPMLDVTLDRPSYQENAEGPLITRDLVSWFWDNYLQSPADRNDPLAVPAVARDLRGLPAAYIAAAEFDVLRDEAAEYAARLIGSGVNVEYRAGRQLIHGFIRMHESALAVREFEALRSALRRALL